MCTYLAGDEASNQNHSLSSHDFCICCFTQSLPLQFSRPSTGAIWYTKAIQFPAWENFLTASVAIVNIPFQQSENF